MDIVTEELIAADEVKRNKRMCNASHGLNDDGTPIGNGDGQPYQRGIDFDVAPRNYRAASFNLISLLLFQNSTLGGNIAALMVWGWIVVIGFFILESQGIYLLPLK